MKFRHSDGEYRMIADVTPCALVRAGIVISMVAGMFLISVCPQILADLDSPWVSTTK